MRYDKSFYLTLPSNASSGLYKNNTASAYTTKLANPIEISGDSWEAALVSIQYPPNWLNVPERESAIDIYLHEPVAPGLVARDKQALLTLARENNLNMSTTDLIRCRKCITARSGSNCVQLWFRAGFYASVESLVRFINMCVRLACLNSSINILDYDKHLQLVTVDLAMPITKVLFRNGAINQILGLTKIGGSDEVTVEYNAMIPSIHYAPHYPDINNGVNTFFIYADFVEAQHVGDAYPQLLRCVPANSLSGVATIEKPQYTRVIRNSFTTTEISICDLAGRPINFQRGVTVCTIHFRPSRL